MKTWIAARWRSIVAVGAALSLVLGAGVVVLVHTLEGSRSDAADCSTLEADSFAAANALSQACAADVEVLADRTPWQTSWATADNAARLEVSILPSRVQVDGEWTDLNASLVLDEQDNSVSVAAPVFPIELNAGGDAGRGKPLGSIERDGHTLEVWFPLELPAPILSDSQAAYQLGTGIRLLVSVNVDATGFVPVIELADADAAALLTTMLDEARANSLTPSTGLDLDFVTVLSDGLTLTIDDSSAVGAVDAAGEVQFFAAPPIMWDSSGSEIPVRSSATEVGLTDRTRSPVEGDQIAPMGVTLAGNSIVVSPDAAMVQSADTVWPLYIDPSFGTQTPSKWVAVRKGGYTGTLVNWGDISSSMLGQGTGYCQYASSCNVVFYQRLAWRFSGLAGIAAMDGSDITAATFTVDGQHSYNCTSQSTTLYRTSDINGFGTGANWNNLSWLQALGSRSEYHSNSCGNKGMRGFNALAGVQWAADNNSSSLNLGLAVGEANMTPWKRFRANATLAISYNRAPETPTLLQFDSPEVSVCTTGAGRPLIASTTPTISALSTDPDGTNVQTAFVVATQNNLSDIRWDSGNLAALAPGSRRAATVPSGLVDGGVYAWQARAFDGARYSAWSEWCEFEVDVTAPLAPMVEPVITGVDAIYMSSVERGGVGQHGSFIVSRGIDSDAVSFDYYFIYGSGNPGVVSTPATEPDGTAIIDFTPSTTGPVILSVTAVDAAGNFSQTTTYSFDVASPTEDGIWTLDEGTGTTAADSAGNPERPLTVIGADWSQGPHGLFDSRPGDTALTFDGVGDFAEASAPVVDTEDSFVVSAHVWLDAEHVAQAQSFTALGQDGVTESGFDLGYQDSCPGMPTGCWSFSMPDAPGAATTTSVLSSVPVTGDEWTYLVGEHDATNGTLRLWVCEIGSPTDPAVGDPVKSETTRSATPWAASGAFTVGRGLGAGSHAKWWPGSIDNIRVFSGEVLAESKIRRLCQGAEASDFGGDATALDPTFDEAEVQ